LFIKDPNYRYPKSTGVVQSSSMCGIKSALQRNSVRQNSSEGCGNFPSPKILKYWSEDIYLGCLIQRDTWHLIQEVTISRLNGFCIECDTGSWSTWELGPWSQLEVAWSDGKKLHQRSKAPALVTKEDMRGFKMPGLTQRNHEDSLEHSGVLGLIPIPIKVVNESRRGCWKLVSLHKWKV